MITCINSQWNEAQPKDNTHTFSNNIHITTSVSSHYQGAWTLRGTGTSPATEMELTLSN